MPRKVTVLGGSTPFVIPLFESWSRRRSVENCDVVIHGRTERTLGIVAARAAELLAPLGCRVSASTSLEKSVAGADTIIHKIRYGGMAGRIEDETLAADCGGVPDESLGIGGMAAALRMRIPLLRTAEAIHRNAPDAWVINMTNPLGLSTALLHDGGISRVLGVCELPQHTALHIAGALGCDAGELEWEYAGFNHRGFIYDVRVGGEPSLDALIERLERQPLPDIRTTDVQRLRAVPQKYFRLYCAPEEGQRARRAEFVSAVRTAQLEQLEKGEAAASAGRPSPWYEESIVPALEALHDERPRAAIVNRRDDDGVVRERRAMISRHGLSAAPPAKEPSDSVTCWLATFETQERAVFESVIHPTHDNIIGALRSDALVPREAVTRAARILWDRHRRDQDE